MTAVGRAAVANCPAWMVGCVLAACTCGVTLGQRWQDAEVVTRGTEVQLAFNNTHAAVRDRAGLLHVLWNDELEVHHGRQMASSGTWTIGTLPRAPGTARQPRKKATIARLGNGDLISAWLQRGRVFVSRSRDRGATWSDPLELSGSSAKNPSLWTVENEGGPERAVLAWATAHGDQERVWVRSWQGGVFAADAWSAARQLSPDGDAARDIAVAGFGDDVFACWEVGRVARTAVLHRATSADGGQSWSESSPLELRGGSEGGDPSVAWTRDGAVLLGYQKDRIALLVESTDGGRHFDRPQRLGLGLFVHLSQTDPITAVAWEYIDRSIHLNEEKRVGFALSVDGRASLDRPFAMPDSYETFGAKQAAVATSMKWVDVFWVESTGDFERLMHRAADMRAL